MKGTFRVWGLGFRVTSGALGDFPPTPEPWFPTKLSKFGV